MSAEILLLKTCRDLMLGSKILKTDLLLEILQKENKRILIGGSFENVVRLSRIIWDSLECCGIEVGKITALNNCLFFWY